jgi:hypothetical protein
MIYPAFFDQIETAFATLGKQIAIEIRDAA